MTHRIVVLSDLHIAPPGPLSSFHSGAALASCLAKNGGEDTCLVLAGDIFDFLQLEDRPSTLDMPGAPKLIRRMFDLVAEESWGKDIFRALGAHLAAGGTMVVMPGNHDPELFHPDARELLLEAMARPGFPGLSFHTEDTLWSCDIGSLHVKVGHGNRPDPWNDIDPKAVKRAIAMGARDVALPPGSRIVLNVINQFKQARDPDSGKPRFPFVDLLKPEIPGVLLVLFYLDAPLCVSLLDKALGIGVARLTRSFSRLVRLKPVLGAAAPLTRDAPLEQALADEIADALIGDDERGAPDAAIANFDAVLAGAQKGGDRFLASHGKRRWPIRRWLRSLGADTVAYFDPAHMSKEDKQLVGRYLPDGQPPAIAIFGHTHAARQVALPGGRTYINTGTWMDLMDMPVFATDGDMERWIDAVEANRVPRLTPPRRTYAEVTADGARLCEFAAESGQG